MKSMFVTMKQDEHYSFDIRNFIQKKGCEVKDCKALCIFECEFKNRINE